MNQLRLKHESLKVKIKRFPFKNLTDTFHFRSALRTSVKNNTQFSLKYCTI